MRKVIVSTFLSLDGVTQAPGGPEEDPTGGFTLGGWSVNFWDDSMAQQMTEAMSEPFDLLLGRKTYEIFAAHWPYVTDDPGADALNRATKYVASRTLEELEWTNSVVIGGDVGEEVARLKEGSGPEIQVHGSRQLIQTLMEHDLVDQYRLWTFPVLLGSGKRLFEGGTIHGTLRLVDATTSTTGVVMATYEPAGEIDLGSFALEEPTEAEVERRRRLDSPTVDGSGRPPSDKQGDRG
jgi:dihydrofolate reductase